MTAPALTKAELRTIGARLQSLLPPGPRPLNAEEIVEVNAIVDKTREMIAASAAVLVRGAKVLDWRIPNVQAPTMNQYVFMKHWQRVQLRKKLDEELLKIIERSPDAKVHGAKTQRWVRVTRFTTVPASVDGTDPDTLGAKMALDSLVRCGVLIDDTPALCVREGLVRKTPRGNTHVLLEVFTMATEEVPDPGPLDATVEQPPRRAKKKRGLLTEAIVNGQPTLKPPTAKRRA